MTIKSLHNKKICLLGLGIENHALLEFLLAKKIPAEITVCDARTKRELKSRYGACVKGVTCKLGRRYDSELEGYDIIFRVAGYPLFSPAIIKAMMAGVTISSPTKLFFDICPTKNTIGVTGTKGKGTIASLIYQVLGDAGKRAHFGGNIGIPLFSFFEKIKPHDWVVLELSSFQLEDLHASPHIAVITNFFPEHLASGDPHNPNHHKTMPAYWEAKTNIFSHQNAKDFLIASSDLRVKLRHEKIPAKIRYFTTSSLETPLVGNHNKRNIAAAQVVARIVGITPTRVAESVASFKGLEHRLEFVGTQANVQYYNDSFATTPEAALTALHAFNPGRVILIAGGASKGARFNALAAQIKKYASHVVLLPGKGSDDLTRALAAQKVTAVTTRATMKTAVQAARKKSRPGDVVLLAPACASFGIFKNYKDRGEQFKRAAMARP